MPPPSLPAWVTGLAFISANLGAVETMGMSANGTILNVLLGWPLWVAVIAAAVIVLSYITLGGLSAAIYNEALQFFVIMAALLPRTLIGLHRVSGWSGLRGQVSASPGGAEQLDSRPGNALSGFADNFWSVFGLGFVLSFGYWTTNFVEVQRALATHSISAARRTPVIGAYPKIFIPLIVVTPGMISAVLVPQMAEYKQAAAANPDVESTVTYNDALLYLMKEVLPNGLLGVGLAGLLAGSCRTPRPSIPRPAGST